MNLLEPETNIVDNAYCIIIIRENGSTLYIGMAREKNGRPYISIASSELFISSIYMTSNTI